MAATATTAIGAGETIEWPWLRQRALYCDEYGIGTTGGWVHMMQIPITIRISEAAWDTLRYRSIKESLLTELRLFAVTDTGEEHQITCVRNRVFNRSDYPPASDLYRSRVAGTWPPETEESSDTDSDDDEGLTWEEEREIIEQYWPMYEFNVMPHRVDRSDNSYYDPFRREDPSYRPERWMMSFHLPEETNRVVGFKANLVQGTYGETQVHPAEVVVTPSEGKGARTIQDGLLVRIETIGKQRWHLPTAKLEVKLEYGRFAKKPTHEPDVAVGDKRGADEGEPPPAKRRK